MTHSAQAATATAVLDQLMAQAGVDGLVAAMRNPGLMAVVDQHAATIREALHASGREVDAQGLASYARSVLAVLDRMGHTLPHPATVDWASAGAHLLRLVAICQLAEEAGVL